MHKANKGISKKDISVNNSDFNQIMIVSDASAQYMKEMNNNNNKQVQKISILDNLK